MKKLLLAAAFCFVVALSTGLFAGSASGRIETLTGSIDRTYSENECGNNFCWVCDGAVDLDSVTIDVDTNEVRIDGVRFAPGCTGTIDELTITTESADGLKIAEGAHDITVGGGEISCTDKVHNDAPDPSPHQDGIQALGGDTITFNGLTIDCGRQNDTLIDSNLFIKKAGSSVYPPNEIVCDGCWLGPDAAHTVNLQESTYSGVENSTICQAKYPTLTFTVGTLADHPVNSGNSFPTNCSVQPTLDYEETILADQPTEYWRLGEQGDWDLHDIGPYNISGGWGTFDDPVTLGVTGAIDGDEDTAVSLNGTSQYGIVPDTSALRFYAEMTVEAWVKSTASGWQTILGKALQFEGRDGNSVYALSLDDGAPVLDFAGDGDPGWVRVVAPSAMGSGWHHVVGTFDNGTATLYVDGEEVASDTGDVDSIGINDSELWIGGMWTETESPFNGSLDEIALYANALSPEQIANHYAVGSGN